MPGASRTRRIGQAQTARERKTPVREQTRARN
jgi:hypothetical protein